MGRRFACFVLIAMWLAVSVWGQDSESATEKKIRLLEQQLEMLRQELADLKEAVNQPQSKDNQVATAAEVKGLVANPSLNAEAISKPSDPNSMHVYWKDGVHIESADEKFQFRVGGRIMNDWAFVGVDESLQDSLGLGNFAKDGTEFRRARVYLSGVVHDRVEFKAQYDFVGRLANFRDVYVGFRGVPVFGTIRAGHYKEPFGLEELTSSNHVTFLERAAGGGFAPSRNTGIGFENAVAEGRMTYAAGIFRETIDSGESVGSGGPNVTGRLTGLPIWGDDGRKLLHLGIAYSRQGTPLSVTDFEARPEAHLAPPFVFTPLIPARKHELLGLEAAAVAGPFSVQSEYQKAFVDSPVAGDPSFQGFYVQASFFPTGESRPYSQSHAVFDRVRPRHSFLDDHGAGAWEIAARYSWLDLNDQGIQGGEMKNLGFGLNWYMNPYTRLMWNYIHSRVQDTGDADIIQMRFKIDF